MEMHLQFGYGMMEHCRTLVRDWGASAVILSPRDLLPAQLHSLSNDIRREGGTVYVDPQFYLPDADHERLTQHEFWPQEYESASFWSGPELQQLLTRLNQLNRDLGCAAFILPGLYVATADDDWIARQRAVLDEAERLGLDPGSLILTIALASDAVRNVQQVHDVLDAAANWRVGGIYLVCEHPNGEYLVDDPIWVANILDMTAGFRLQGKAVVLGYCNHQMLIAACAGASAIASGTWMNVRMFPPDKFRTQLDDEIKKRTTWYYCPQALSEYRIPTLDIAMLQGILGEMTPPAELGSTYANILFQGVQPSTVSFTEQAAFRHYLQSLRSQVVTTRHGSFDVTASEHEAALDRAEILLHRLHGLGVRGQLRDFLPCIDANRAALAVLRTNRGAMLRRRWATL